MSDKPKPPDKSDCVLPGKLPADPASNELGARVEALHQAFTLNDPVALGDARNINVFLSDFTGLHSHKLHGSKVYDASVVEWSYPERSIDSITAQQSRELEREIAELKRQRDEQATTLREQKEGSRKQEEQIQELQSTVTQLREKERLSFLLERVNPAAQKALLGSMVFRQKFLASSEVPAFVMSVDIRRSTELMLKARRPEQFADFITTLCGDLMKVVTDCFGIVDKFTGDGILAFFPEFFSGADASYLAVNAASRCHEVFTNNYRSYRNCFNSILKDVGLGIGIDYGMLHLVQIAGGLTVVGQPVVYACRLGGCPAGKTLLNQPAYERISERFSGNIFVRETELEIKHEGSILAYEVALNGNPYQAQIPEWLELTDKG
jgi:class 3 adenylate cyclase